MGFAADYIDRKTGKKSVVDLGGNAALEKAKANQVADDRISKEDYAAATAPELNGYDAYVASAIGGASRTLSGKRGGGAKYNEGRFKGKTKFEAMAILDKEYREMGDEGRASWEQRHNTPLSQSQMDIRAKAADARNKIAVAGNGQSGGASAPTAPTSQAAIPFRPATPGGQAPTMGPNSPAPSPPAPRPMMSAEQFRLAQTQVNANGKSERMPVASSPVARAATSVAQAQAPAAPAQRPGMSQASTPTPSVRPSPAIMGTGPVQGPKLPAFDRAAATAKAQGEVASMFADAAQKAPLVPRGDRSVPLPMPPANGTASAMRGFNKASESAMRVRNPGMTPTPSEIPTAPKPVVAATRAGKMATKPLADPDIAAYEASKPTEFIQVTRTGGRAGATKRVAATPSPTRTAAQSFASR